MARLEAVAKALYYPTPERVVEMIAGIVQLSIESWGPQGRPALLDPCAGEGTAASILARRWDVVAHGIELHKGRADAAAGVLAWVRHGSYHQLTALDSKGEPMRSDGYGVSAEAQPFSVLFLNPPYDEGTDETGAKMRQEIEFLRATTRFLAPTGLLVFIPPRHILRSKAFREYMRNYYTDIRAYAFPDPEVDAFDQVVVLARRGRNDHCYGDIAALEGCDSLPPLDTAEPYEASVPFRIAKVDVRGRAPESYAPADNEGAWLAQQWQAHTGEGAAHELAPLVAPRPGHQAMLLAVGALNGLEIGTEAANDNACSSPLMHELSLCACAQRPPHLLVKGGSVKVITTIKSKDETIERERIASYLSVLNLATGELDHWQVDDAPEKTAEWFRQHGEALAAGILAAHAPQFRPGDLAAFDLSGLQAPGILPGRSAPEILQVQREASAAVVHRWFGGPRWSRRRRGNKAVILCGEMGTGKTTMAVVACELAGAQKVVIICPTHLTRKWAREAETITGRKGVAVIGKQLSDIDAFFASPTATYLVLSKETAKLGARWEPAFAQGGRIINAESKRTDPQHSWRTITETKTIRRKFKACPKCGGEVVLDKKDQSRCGNKDARGKVCGESLWQSVPISSKMVKGVRVATKRWPLAAYIHDRYAGRYTLVVDEAHQHAKGETDQAQAVHQLITAARKVLMMTGTLYGGYASSIFFLLYRIDPLFRRAYKYTDVATFVQHHGLFETVHKEEERTSTYGRHKGRTGGRLREIPGMSPAMIPMLLPYTVFVKLRDLRLELPPYTEEVMLVEPDPEVLAAATEFQTKLKGLLRKHPRVLGAYLQACLGYPDRPDQREDIYDVIDVEIDNDEDLDGEEIADLRRGELLASAPALDPDSYPKDEDLLAVVERERAQGRKVLVFFTQTKRRDARPRVRAALEAAGLKVVQLDAKVAPEKREQWMRDQCEAGFDVMFTNGRLVETGLDLMFAATIIQYSIEFSINTLRQSIRRSWRLGQRLGIRVIFMAYRGTLQANALDLIARKMRSAELVDGDEAGGLAQFDAGGGNFLLELAHEVLEAA